MASWFWKCATLVGFGAAAYLAVCPLASLTRAAPTAQEKLLLQLRLRSHPDAVCDSIEHLAGVVDERVTVVLGELTTRGELHARQCAVEILGTLPADEARHRLWQLVEHRDPIMSSSAVAALASRVDDTEARRMLLQLVESPVEARSRAALTALANNHVEQVVPAVLRKLEHASWSKKAELVTALGAAGGPMAAEALEKLARAESDSLRTTALEALGSGNVDEERAVAVLSEALWAEHGMDARTASAALARLGTELAQKTLLRAAASTRQEVAGAAVSALVQFEGDEVRALMKENLRSPHLAQQLAAVEYHQHYPDDSTLGALMRLAEKNGLASEGAVRAIGQLRSDEARHVLVELASKAGRHQSDALTTLRQTSAGDGQVRSIALALLRAGKKESRLACDILRQERSAEGRLALLDAARSGDGRSSKVTWALAGRGDEASLRALGDLAVESSQSQTREAAMSALSSTGSRAAFEALSRVLQVGDLQDRERALDALAALGGLDVERLLRQAMIDVNPKWRLRALRAFARCARSPQATAELVPLAAEDDPSVAKVALRGLMRRSPEVAARLAREKLHSSNPEVRQSFEVVDGFRDLWLVRPMLLEALADSDVQVVETAALALVQLQDWESIEALAGVLDRTDVPPHVQQAIVDMLESGGEPIKKRHATRLAKHSSRDSGRAAR